MSSKPSTAIKNCVPKSFLTNSQNHFFAFIEHHQTLNLTALRLFDCAFFDFAYSGKSTYFLLHGTLKYFVLSPRSQFTKKMSFENYINNNNKILLAKYATQILTMQLSNFVAEVKYPLLTGKDLFEGEFSEKTIHGPNATFKFSVAQKNEQQNTIAKSTYVVRKGIDNRRLQSEQITVGRSAKCDITIADYSISKHHATIMRYRNTYSIIDRGSTNGVRVKDKLLTPETPHPILIGQTIQLGRFSFLFIHPVHFYCMLYVSTTSSLPPQKELISVARETPLRFLSKVAQSCGYQENGSKNDILHYLHHNSVPFQLIKELSLVPLYT